MTTEQQFKPIIQFINRRAPIWKKRLCLSEWDIKHVFVETTHEHNDYATAATTAAAWQYLSATITWYLPVAVRFSEDFLEATLVHELTHVMLSPEQNLIDTRIASDSANNQYTTSENDALTDRNYELMEFSTEMVTKALLKGWQNE
jgi:hypothetical protein